jgi:hypothetical protein
MLSPLWLSKQFARLVTAAGLPKIRLHGLRHSHASMARDAGVPVEVLSRRLGHSRTSTTSDLYVTTHRLPAALSLVRHARPGRNHLRRIEQGCQGWEARSHSDAPAGCIVSSTTARTSALRVSRSISDRSRVLNAAIVRAAS